MAAMTPEQIAALDADAAAGTAEPGKVTDYTAIEGGLKVSSLSLPIREQN